jgi:membrane-bound serine protease (ClpP class)
VTWAILLLGLGLILVVAETLFPSFGVLTILATASIIGSVVMAFRESADTGLGFLVVTALAVPVCVIGGLKLFPRTPMGKRMTVSGLSFESRVATDTRDLALVGRRGVVLSDCRPAGTARFDGRRVDVVSRGELLERGTPVQVAEVRGNRVVVTRDSTPAHEHEPDGSGSPASPESTAGA